MNLLQEVIKTLVDQSFCGLICLPFFTGNSFVRASPDTDKSGCSRNSSDITGTVHDGHKVWSMYQSGLNKI